jgi:hypothetical protein
MQKTMASMNYFDFNWQNLDYFLKWNKYADIKFTVHNADAFLEYNLHLVRSMPPQVKTNWFIIK